MPIERLKKIREHAKRFWYLFGVSFFIAIPLAITFDSWYQVQVQPIIHIAEARGLEVLVPEPKVVLIGVHIDWTPERIEMEYQRAADRHTVSFFQMWTTVQCENPVLDPKLQSYWDDPKGPNGRENSWGLSQIHLDYHPTVSREQAQDPAFAAEFMASKFAQGKASLWTCWRDNFKL